MRLVLRHIWVRVQKNLPVQKDSLSSSLLIRFHSSLEYDVLPALLDSTLFNQKQKHCTCPQPS